MLRMTLRSVAAFVVSGIALFAYYQYEKSKVEAKKAARNSAGGEESAGKPLVGGPFSLVDHDGRPVTDMDYRGKYLLLYFGYTFCPDVCPEELEKMAIVVNNLQEQKGWGEETIVPIFISCDPKRDSIESIKEYVKEFHPRFIGMTGTHQQIKRVARAYRMYYSAPPRAADDDDTDYLVDHSIFYYLVDPQGQYVSHFGRQETAESVTAKLVDIIAKEKEKQSKSSVN
ncbi:Cu-binding protein [Quaeritorhiza haematococci]|nr:Cu-binding protein [Quaeritorhiza haematococci]